MRYTIRNANPLRWRILELTRHHGSGNTSSFGFYTCLSIEWSTLFHGVFCRVPRCIYCLCLCIESGIINITIINNPSLSLQEECLNRATTAYPVYNVQVYICPPFFLIHLPLPSSNFLFPHTSTPPLRSHSFLLDFFISFTRVYNPKCLFPITKRHSGNFIATNCCADICSLQVSRMSPGFFPINHRPQNALVEHQNFEWRR